MKYWVPIFCLVGILSALFSKAHAQSEAALGILIEHRAEVNDMCVVVSDLPDLCERLPGDVDFLVAYMSLQYFLNHAEHSKVDTLFALKGLVGHEKLVDISAFSLSLVAIGMLCGNSQFERHFTAVFKMLQGKALRLRRAPDLSLADDLSWPCIEIFKMAWTSPGDSPLKYLAYFQWSLDQNGTRKHFVALLPWLLEAGFNRPEDLEVDIVLPPTLEAYWRDCPAALGSLEFQRSIELLLLPKFDSEPDRILACLWRMEKSKKCFNLENLDDADRQRILRVASLVRRLAPLCESLK